MGPGSAECMCDYLKVEFAPMAEGVLNVLEIGRMLEHPLRLW